MIHISIWNRYFTCKQDRVNNGFRTLHVTSSPTVPLQQQRLASQRMENCTPLTPNPPTPQPFVHGLCLRCARSCLYYLFCRAYIVLLPAGWRRRKHLQSGNSWKRDYARSNLGGGAASSLTQPHLVSHLQLPAQGGADAPARCLVNHQGGSPAPFVTSQRGHFILFC